MATGKRVPETTKITAVRQLEQESRTLEELAKAHKVKPLTIMKWKRQHGACGSKPSVSTGGPSLGVKDAIAFLEMAEKAVIEELTTRKRKRMTKSETYMLLALSTLREA